MISHLDAAEVALKSRDRPLSAKELVSVIQADALTELGGATPWKTVNARISTDILEYREASRFKRTFHGRFALRHWQCEPEFEVPRRSLAPLEETIKAVPASAFSSFDLEVGKLTQLSIRSLVEVAVDVLRSDAETSQELVQLIPTFVVDDGASVLSYKRTKRLPEARLHDARCLNFGGHMQSEDLPSLFWNDDDVFGQFVARELYEELSFSEPPIEIVYCGLLYLTGNEFERQHAGLVHIVRVKKDSEVASLEPGLHTDLRFVPKEQLSKFSATTDSWSACLSGVLYGPL